MHTPQQALDSATDRASEITWWNRQLSRLNEVVDDGAATSFVENEIVENKGPYVEFVDAPKFDEQPAGEFFSGLDYSEELIEAITTELFGGDPNGSLYQHQAEMIDAIESNSSDNILSVPTATGKTESFFFPILDHCLSTDESGLKSLVVYPMKTLGVDQLNRFITYLYQVNRSRSPENQITIGIWDSDTPTRLGTRGHEIEEGSYVRGLECPQEDGEKLRVLDDMTVGTDDHTYSWIRVTRDAIRNGADILLTNPEALDHMFVSNNSETRAILGEDAGQHPVKHIVFDEAHVWSGISGASIRLLTERLKKFYADQNPQVSMVSATVDNPTELAHDLTGTPESEINSIGFTSREFPIHTDPRFGRFAPCNIATFSGILAIAHLENVTLSEVREKGLEEAYLTAREVGLVELDADEYVCISSGEEWVHEKLRLALDELIAGSEFDNMGAVANSANGWEQLGELLLERGGLYSEWFEFVINAVPEVAEFAHWFDEDTTGEVGFKHYNELVEAVAASDVSNPERTLQTVMMFGRLAGMITEKYHVFLKPPSKVALCESCGELTRDKICSNCNIRTAELQFCKRCHYPYIETDDGSTEKAFRPYDYATRVDNCPGCGQWPRLTDIGVPTTSLLSYMLTEVCRTTPSKKTLVFSDSHSSAESVGDRIIGTEYGLMAQTLYIQELIERGGSADNYDLFRAVSDRLREEYWEPLLQNDIDEDGTAYNFLRTLLDDIEGHAMLFNASQLLDSALVTADPVAEINDPNKLVIAHEIYKLFVTGSGASFTKNTVKIEGLSLPKIVDRVASRSGYAHDVIREVLPEILESLLESSVVVEQTWDEVRRMILNSNIEDERKEDTFDYIEQMREEFAKIQIDGDESESGIITRVTKRDRSNLVLLERAAFCTECYRSYPVPDDDAISTCPHCNTTIKTYRRFNKNDDGNLVASPGYADADSSWPYALDHWAYDITTPIRDGNEPEFITVGIHKGNIPHTLRGAIEEGFRKNEPDVNIVSATPTMELGVDIGTLDTVSQVGIPPTLTNYVQRSGRTGRTRGSSSLVMTAIRGEHPVDGHYYGNLETFLDEFEPVRVPDPYRFSELLTGHVVTEAIAYLARNPHSSNVFEKMYELNETNQDLGAFVSQVEEHIDILTEFLLSERREALERHIRSIFGEAGITAFEQAFVDDGPLSVENRVVKTFSRITAMSGSTETNKAFTESNNRLDRWLSQLGYLANYRSFGQQFPVKFKGRNEGIEFEGSGRLYDMFPGPENDLGSVVTLHGTDYIVDDVHGSATPLATVKICANNECDRPFESYGSDSTQCPYCDEPLEKTPVHGVSSVECKTARGGQKRYNTRGIMTTDISSGSARATQEEASWTVFGMPCEASYGELEVTDFIYAYERRHSSSPDTKVLKSEALIERDASTSTSGLSWQERLEDADTEEYAPVGQQYHTQGVTLQFDSDQMAARFEQVEHDPTWPQALVSLEQAFEKAIAVVAQCDRSDFRVEAEISDSDVVIQIIDSRQGGNGISWQVWEAIKEITANVADVASCERCNDYCDECLLLSRTPGYYLENDLLNRQTLGAIVSGD